MRWLERLGERILWWKRVGRTDEDEARWRDQAVADLQADAKRHIANADRLSESFVRMRRDLREQPSDSRRRTGP